MEPEVTDLHGQPPVDGGQYLRTVDGMLRMPTPATGADQVVWHHTDAAALKSILENRCVRASAFGSLNDSSEINYGFNVLRKLLDQYKARLDPSKQDFLASLVSDDFRVGLRDQCFVFCATKQKDSLNQWQNYSHQQGYAIGLKTGSTFALAEHQESVAFPYGLTWVDVIYKPKEQRQLATRCLDFIMDNFSSDSHFISGSARVDEAKAQYEDLMAYLVAACKHKSFAVESEVRYVAFEMGREMQFRTGKRGIVPYVDCHFNRFEGEHDNGDTSVVGIMCAPGNRADQDEDKANVRRMLNAYRYPRTITVEASKVPYRF